MTASPAPFACDARHRGQLCTFCNPPGLRRIYSTTSRFSVIGVVATPPARARVPQQLTRHGSSFSLSQSWRPERYRLVPEYPMEGHYRSFIVSVLRVRVARTLLAAVVVAFGTVTANAMEKLDEPRTYSKATMEALAADLAASCKAKFDVAEKKLAGCHMLGSQPKLSMQVAIAEHLNKRAKQIALSTQY